MVFTNIVFHNPVGIAIDIAAAVFFAFPVLLLNKFKKYQFAISLFLSGYHLALSVGTFHSIVEGRESGIEYLFIPGAIAIILLVTGAWQYIIVMLNFAILLSLNYIRFEYYDGGDFTTYFRLTLILVAAYVMVYFFVANFKNQLFRTLGKTEKLNADLREKEEALLDSNRSKDRLFSIISHDLKSPLGAIQGLMEPEVIQSMSQEDYLKYAEKVREKVDTLHTVFKKKE